MPSNFTENYYLSQWERTDKIQMEDFNADNAKIDGALKAEADTRSAQMAALNGAVAKLGNCQIYFVSYTGGGEDTSPSLTFPEQPIIVYLMQGSSAFAPCVYGTDLSRTVGYSPDTSFHLTWSGNTLSWSAYAMNHKNVSYQAIALCAKD